MLEWNIQSRAHVCHATGRTFADGEPCHTVLVTAGPLFERLDLSEEGWKAQGAEILARPGLVSHWKGVYHAPPPAPPEAIAKGDAETLLRKLVERRDERHAAACYILAVMLERKRILKVKQQLRENGRRVFVYEQGRTGDVFVITDPDLHLEQLEAVQRDVASLLEHGLPSDAPAPVEEPFNAPSEVASLTAEAPEVDATVPAETAAVAADPVPESAQS
jgi:hypothetical protein